MAQLKIMMGSGVTSSSPAIAPGQLLFDTTDKSIYLDTVDSKRVKLYDGLKENVNKLIDKLNGINDGETVLQAISDAIGTLTIGDQTYTTVKAYVDKKTEGIATNTALDALTTRVTTAEGKLDTLNGSVGTDGSVAKKIDDAIKALDLANTYETKGAADAKDSAIAAAKKAGDDAQTSVNNLSAKVGTVTEGKTVVDMINDAKTAATYDDTALKARVSANETAISTLNGTGDGSVKKQVADAVAGIVADAPEAYDTLKEISDWITTHGGSATEMNTQINTNKTNITNLTNLVGTLPSEAGVNTIVEYIDKSLEWGTFGTPST